MTNDTSNNPNVNTEANRERARLLYAQGLSVTQISKELDEKRPTVASWKYHVGDASKDACADWYEK